MDEMVLTDAEGAGLKGRLLIGRILWGSLVAGQLSYFPTRDGWARVWWESREGAERFKIEG